MPERLIIDNSLGLLLFIRLTGRGVEAIMKQVPHAELYQVHPNRITEWKKQLFEHAADIRSDKFPLTH